MSNTFLPDKIELGGVEYEFDIDGDLSVHESDLDMEYRRQSANFCRYATGYELALYEEKKHKAAMEVGAARLDHAFRMDAKEKNVKMTEKMVENSVRAHVDYITLEEEFLQSQRKTGLLKEAKEAMIQKSHMLKELGQTQRQERGSDPSMRAEYVKSNRG